MPDEKDMEALLSEMRRQGQAERQEVLSEARQQAEEIADRAEADVEKIKAGAMAQLERQLALESDKALGRARATLRNELLAVRRELVAEAFSQARKKILAGRDHEADKRLLGELIAEALVAVGAEARVSVSAEQIELCRQAVAQRNLACDLQPSDQPAWTVIATSSDDTRQVDNSLATRLERVETLMTCEVSKVLFAEADSGGEGK